MLGWVASNKSSGTGFFAARSVADNPVVQGESADADGSRDQSLLCGRPDRRVGLLPVV